MPLRMGALAWGAALLLGASPGAAQQTEPVLKEKVSVVNVEVPVRVLLDGVPLTGLQREDFRLYEDNVPQAIHGFSLRRKKMSVQNVRLVAEPGAPPPRYFVLCFRVTDYNDPLRQGMDLFFRSILREQDQLLAFVNERTLLLSPHLGQDRRREILAQVLSEEAARARQEMEAFFQRVREDIDQNRLRVLIEGSGQSFTLPQIIVFLQDYLNVWRGFKGKYLVPDLDRFYNFSHHLKKISGEKWVLNFYQVETFPKMRIGGSLRRQIDDLVERLNFEGGAAEHFARVIVRTLEEIDRALNTAGDFPAEQVAKMLIGVDTTYHCFVSGVAREGMSEDLEYRKVASDLENTLRKITESSGGEVVVSGDLGSALHAVEEKEDAYYVLTYEPKNPGRPGKVRVELDNPRCRLLYDDQVRSDYIAAYLEKRKAEEPTLQLDRLSLSGTRLRMDISSFRMAEAKARRTGRLRVAVTIRDGADRTLVEQSRELAASEARVSLTVDFPFLKPGKYYFLVEARDLLSGRAAMDVRPAEVR